MAQFTGKLISAQYVDTEYSIIKAVWDDEGTNNVYHLEVNPDHPDYQDLLAEGWDHERIANETAEIKRAQSNAFNTQVNIVAQELAKKMLAEKDLNFYKTSKIEAKAANSELYDLLLEQNENKDDLFKCKLWALETDAVKNSDKQIKSNIRKAKRITTVIGIYDSLLD